MKTLNTKRFSVVLTLALTGACAHAAGFQHGFAADPDGKPLEIGIWYPSSAAVLPVAMGPTTMSVAVKGPVQGKALPLVLISHGTGGSFLGHFDTAMALADAGFVVAAVTHTGDNYADQSRAVDIMDRPRQISRVIDHMLASWDGRAAIDPARVGMFGFSAGGFTTLANIGGVPDFKDRTGVPPIPRRLCMPAPGEKRRQQRHPARRVRHRQRGGPSDQGRSGGRTSARLQLRTRWAQERQGPRAALARRGRCHPSTSALRRSGAARIAAGTGVPPCPQGRTL